jgi:uncharacterized protein
MQGYQVTFFTYQDRRHQGHPLAHWLLQLEEELGLRGATLVGAGEGFGHHKRLHSVRFIDLSDQPLEVVMVLTQQENDRLFERLQAEQVKVFYVRTPAEFGMLGEEDGG